MRMIRIQSLIARSAMLLSAFMLTSVPLRAQQSHAGHGAQPASQRTAQPAPQAGAATAQQLNAVLQRMLADPVIRERVATDPMLQRLMQTAGMQTTQGAQGIAGMQGMEGMKGMDHGNMPMGATVTRQDQQEALQFMARLLGDPAVAETIEDDNTLRRLWADPEVQRRLTELRRSAR